MKNKGNKVLVILITIFTFAIILFAGTYAYFNSVGTLGNVIVSANVAENNSLFTSSGSDIHLEIEEIDMQQNANYLGLVAEDSGYLNVTYLSGTTEPISCEYNVYYKWISGEYTITDPEQLEFTYEVGDGGKGLLAEETNFVPSWYTEPVKISSEKVKITNGSLTTPTVNSHDITARFYNLDKDQTANADKRLKIRFYVDDIVCGVEDKVRVLYFYDTNKSPDQAEVNRGSSVTLPLPVNGDKVFDGWYTYGPSGTFVGNAGDSFTPTKDTTMLYAHWVETPYEEEELDGATPVLTDNMVPVTIENDGTVKKANLNSKWYSYEEKNWANAVVLKDQTISYEDGATIPEANIESYFVWIPKFRYKLFDLGQYNSLTTLTDNTQTIDIEFNLTNTSDAKSGECTTPLIDGQGNAGGSGNCQVGEYMTHPAFITMNVTGFWVGKFETGYDGATTKSEAQVNTADETKIIIKPNVYSWRNIVLGRAYKSVYNYMRDEDSHMMKNTEWGAVAYLSNSKYGINSKIRLNNNSNYVTGYAATEAPTVSLSSSSMDGNRFERITPGLDGTYTINYLNPLSVSASTTGNYSGIFDMAGGTSEVVMGYNNYASPSGGLSNISQEVPGFANNSSLKKYYEKYTINSTTTNTEFTKRILGDATGELGPFQSTSNAIGSSQKSSWYNNRAKFLSKSDAWFARGGAYNLGSEAGIFAFDTSDGGASSTNNNGFRVVLAPIE